MQDYPSHWLLRTAPAAIGMPLAEVETPALLVDLTVLERNIGQMAQTARRAGVALRPHAKAHKSPAIARLQVAAGAVGVCCQTTAEAEALVAGGALDVLVTNQIVGRAKIERLAALTHRARIAVCVDNFGNVETLSDAASRHGVTLGVLVEIEVGGSRCGTRSGSGALALAQCVASAPGLRFVGLQAYHGPAQHLRSHDERAAAIRHTVEIARAARDLLAQHAIECSVITGGGTGTYALEADSGVYTEVQPGSYIFMDGDYSRIMDAAGGPFRDFEQSLFVLSTVISQPAPGVAIVDTGLKAIAVDRGLPTVAGHEATAYIRAADDHGTLQLDRGAASLDLGDKVMLIPGHCDPTVNLHDWYVGFRGGKVEQVWPIPARGPGL